MGLRGTWNHTKSVFRTPCSASGNVGLYIETALRASTPVLTDLLGFGCREPLKHAAGRGQAADWFGRDNVRGFRMPHRRPKVKPGKWEAAGIKAGLNAFWAMDALFERALFYWFLFELGQEFFVNWTSLIYAEQGCGGQPAGLCRYRITDQVIGDKPTDMLISPLPDCHGVASDTRAIYIPAGLQASIGYHVACEPWAPQPIPGTTMTSYLATDEGQAYGASEWDPSQGTGNGLVGHSHNISGGLGGFKRISIRAQSSPGISWCHDGFMDVALQGHAVPLFPLSDCFKQLADSKLDKYLQSLF